MHPFPTMPASSNHERCREDGDPGVPWLPSWGQVVAGEEWDEATCLFLSVKWVKGGEITRTWVSLSPLWNTFKEAVYIKL
mgnify:CR=1 FL=1